MTVNNILFYFVPIHPKRVTFDLSGPVHGRRGRLGNNEKRGDVFTRLAVPALDGAERDGEAAAAKRQEASAASSHHRRPQSGNPAGCCVRPCRDATSITLTSANSG